MVDCVLWVKEGAVGEMRVPVFSGRSHKRAPRSEALTPVVQLLPPVGARCHSELGAEPLVGPGIVGILIPRMRFFSRRGDLQLLKNAPSGEVNMEAIRKERICGLEVVLNRDATSGGGTPNREVQLVLPPIERSGFPGIPSLVCHSDIPGEWGILVLGEDVWEDGLEVTSLVINLYLLVSERERLLLFEMAPRPICCRAFERVGPLVHDLVTMYVTLTGIQNGELMYLAKNLSVPGKVALCELYYHRWLNIGAELENDRASTGRTPLKIPDGYYNACELDDVLQPLGT